ncbi:PIN domain-containing protein [Thermococcus sp. Bubb.Bath]|uniref:PIN domain-containing protein n=1 Tax=Thermococcus sp. Bubb.Bath TaxID=1638242 RepID=UPI001439BC9A|nr:PIN domain-containing protein [Thermococcus sp. Bubb.Bath]NJF25183.1 PIN domain-containing protein [Thermococcus sp. Bubb.Bath]
MDEDKKLYDTNVIIEAVKSGEKLRGYTTILNVIEFPKVTTLDLTVITPSLDDYLLSTEISQAMVEKGTPVPAVDMVVAAVALNRGLTLVSQDKRFLFIREVYQDLKLQLEGL